MLAKHLKNTLLVSMQINIKKTLIAHTRLKQELLMVQDRLLGQALTALQIQFIN